MLGEASPEDKETVDRLNEMESKLGEGILRVKLENEVWSNYWSLCPVSSNKPKGGWHDMSWVSSRNSKYVCAMPPCVYCESILVSQMYVEKGLSRTQARNRMS